MKRISADWFLDVHTSLLKIKDFLNAKNNIKCMNQVDQSVKIRSIR